MNGSSSPSDYGFPQMRHLHFRCNEMLQGDIIEGADRFEELWGCRPTYVYVHPLEMSGQPAEIAGVTLVPSRVLHTGALWFTERKYE